MSSNSTEEKGPPQAMFKLVNPIVKGVLASPLHGLLDKSLMLITFTGRKSGKSYTIPVGYHPQPDGTLRVFSSHTWWKNLRGGKPVSLRLRGQKVAAYAEPITDKSVILPEVEAFIAAHGPENGRRIGVHIDKQNPTAAELAEAAKDTVIIQVTPSEAI